MTHSKPPVAVPTCPDSLTGEARKEWTRITRLLKPLGIVARLDRAVLTCYCLAWARLLQAEAAIAEQGAVIESPSGYAIQNPWLSIGNAAAKQLKGLAGELGLTPAARKRLLGKRKSVKKGANPFAKILPLGSQADGKF